MFVTERSSADVTITGGDKSGHHRVTGMWAEPCQGEITSAVVANWDLLYMIAILVF